MEAPSSLQFMSADNESTMPTVTINGDPEIGEQFPASHAEQAEEAEEADVRQNDARRRRRKVSLACEACRARKIKCDGVIPICGTCRRRRNTADKCSYHNGNSARFAITKEYIPSSLGLCGPQPPY